jgi:predicted dehydrogenase
MSVVNLGLIGAGIAARDLHWPALARLKDKFRVVAVSAKRKENAQALADMAGGADVTTRYEDILERADVEAVVIAVPFQMNARVVQESLAAGKHVLVEKPLAPSEPEARRLAALGRKTALVTMVAENWRYRPIFHRMRELLADGSIGRPFAAFFYNMGKFSPDNKYFSVSTWRLQTPFAPMFMYDGGVHFVAALRFLFGEVESGIAVTTELTAGLGKIDSMTLEMMFRGGMHATMNLYVNSVGHTVLSMLVLGTEGSLHAENNFTTLRIRTAGSERVEQMRETDEGFEAEFLDFYSAIRDHRKPTSTFADAYGDVRVISHALASTRMWKKLRVRP